MKVKTAIIMATFNGEKYLEPQIESLLNQSEKNWQLFIHDDGSSDNTLKIIKNFSSLYPEKIFFIEDKIYFGNPKDNFIFLLKKVADKFDYIMFCDQDDYWKPNKIEKMLKEIKLKEKIVGKNTPILIHSDLEVVDEDLKKISSSLWKFQKLNPDLKTINYLLVQNNITGCATIINKKLAQLSLNIGKNAIMHDWWAALIASTFGVIDYIQEPLVLYRQHGKNDTGAKEINLTQAIRKFFNKEENITSIKKTIMQAQDFLSIFGKNLNEQIKNILISYSNLENYSYIQRIKIIFEYKLLKQDFLRNLGFLFYLKNI